MVQALTIDCDHPGIRGGTARRLAALAGSPLQDRFTRWQGRSGRFHLFSVYPMRGGLGLDDCPAYEDCVILAIRRDPDGSRTILHAEDTGVLPELTLRSPALRQALTAGANEMHMHLLARSPAEREAVIFDLCGPAAESRGRARKA